MIDLDLPGQDGFSLIQEMRRNFPDLPVIAISGVFHGRLLESAKLLGGRPCTPTILSAGGMWRFEKASASGTVARVVSGNAV